MYISIYTYIYIHMYIPICICKYTHMQIYLYIHTYIYVCIYLYTYLLLWLTWMDLWKLAALGHLGLLLSGQHSQVHRPFRLGDGQRRLQRGCFLQRKSPDAWMFVSEKYSPSIPRPLLLIEKLPFEKRPVGIYIYIYIYPGHVCGGTAAH